MLLNSELPGEYNITLQPKYPKHQAFHQALTRRLQAVQSIGPSASSRVTLIQVKSLTQLHFCCTHDNPGTEMTQGRAGQGSAGQGRAGQVRAGQGRQADLFSDDGVHKANEGAGPLGKGLDLVSILDDLDWQKAGCGHHCPVPEGCNVTKTCQHARVALCLRHPQCCWLSEAHEVCLGLQP